MTIITASAEKLNDESTPAISPPEEGEGQDAREIPEVEKKVDGADERESEDRDCSTVFCCCDLLGCLLDMVR